MNVRKIDRVVIHCSFSKPSMDIGAKEIDRWHRKPPHSFLKIGYHFVIRRDGTVEKGRHWHEPGAHAKGFNKHSIGICLVGGMNEDDESEDNFTDDQKLALADLLLECRMLFPEAEILGHRDLPKVTKDCPCFDVAEFLNETGIANV